MNDDAQLLHQYAKEGSEAAFRELVERHIQLVNATARRVVANDAHLAEDVTQLVFTDLANKAATLPENVVLGGWLYRHTCYTAMKAVRGESRRRHRERTAMEINAVNADSARDAQWAQLAPVLDDALNQLEADDRDAIVLRYLQQKDVRSIGLALGASENAAQKRLGRALEKLRDVLTRRGVTISTVLLSTALDAGAATTPVASSLAAAVSSNALSSATTGAAASTSTITTLLAMSTSTKVILSVSALILAAGLLATLVAQKGTPASAVTATADVTPIPAAKANAAIPIAAGPAKVEAPKVAPVPASGSAGSSSEGALTVKWDGNFQPDVGAGALVLSGTASTNAGSLSFGPANSKNSYTATTTKVNDQTTVTYNYANGSATSVVPAPDGPNQIRTTTGPDGQISSDMVVISSATGATGQAQSAADLTEAIDAKKKALDSFQKTAQRVLDQAAAQMANTAPNDPAQMAKIEKAKKEYEDYIVQQQQAIDDLQLRLIQAQSATQP